MIQCWLRSVKSVTNSAGGRTETTRTKELQSFPIKKSFDSSPQNGSLVRTRPGQAAAGAAVFLVQRLAFGGLVLLSIIFLSFLGLAMAQGTSLYPAVAEAGRKCLVYLARLAQGDLGLTTAGIITLAPMPVAEVVSITLFKSLGLLAAALVIATVVGVSLGAWAAGRRFSGHSLAILLASIVGISAPSFFIALILQWLMLRWTQSMGRPLLPVGGFGWDGHLVLPALVLAARPIAQITRITFVSMSEILGQDFIRTAHGKGLRPHRVLSRHVIRNAAVPVLTTIGLSLRFALSSLPVVEFFFGWPGLGFTLLKAISRQDSNLTVALVLCLGILFILVNLLLELSYRLVDPRLRQAAPPERRSPVELIKSLPQAALALLNGVWQPLLANPGLRQLLGRQQAAEPSPFRAVLERRGAQFSAAPGERRRERRRAWWRGTLGNLPLMLGLVLVLGLGAAILFGPVLAPHSPYTTQGLEMVNGKLTVPPFAPGAEHPWGTDMLGRDMLSLVLAGAQQTLLLAALVVLARLLIGFVLGALAGWLPGSWLDRVLVGSAEILAAFPALLLAMMLILAIGIRQGIRPFVIALCFVGWGEIMQFVRSQVLAIRPKLFIESAMAVGLRSPRIILAHVLPNLMPALISLAALEMGAVLMLLGELGFIGIFIGGGAFAELDAGGLLYHYSDVPEWGSLLSNVRPYARSYPWTAIYPTLAFFVAILGFNLFGEGVRRMVERLNLGMTRIFNRYTLAAALLLALGLGWARNYTGAMAFYRQQAATFEADRALTHLQVLANPVLDGRGLGTPGMEAGSRYIARQFESLGLQAAGEDFSYFQTRSRSYQALDRKPQLTIEDGGPALAYRRDFAEYPGGYYRNLGQAQGQVRVLVMGKLTSINQYRGVYPALNNINAAEEVVLTLSAREAAALVQVPRGGVLVVANDPGDMARRYTLPARDPNDGTRRQVEQDTPVLWISQDTADRLLQGTGQTVSSLRRLAETLQQDEIYDLRTGITVSMAVEGTVHEKVPVRHVIGHLPGLSAELDEQLIMVLAQYDSPPPGPDGAPYPAAVDNAAGVAVMLEVIRTMQESDYQPYKTFLFIAYSGEGMEGGEPVLPPNVTKFLDAKYGFSTAFDLEAVIYLRGLGAEGDGLILSAGGSKRLADLFARAARQMGVTIQRSGEPVDLSIVFDERSSLTRGGQQAPEVGLMGQNWQDHSHLPTDTLDRVSADQIDRAGRALAMALLMLGRETQY